MYCDYSNAGVTLAAGTKYKVAVVNGTAIPDSWNSATLDYWSTGDGSNGISNGPLSAPNESGAPSPGQGTYNFGSSFTYPDTYDTGGAPTYWVDVEVVPSPTSTKIDASAFLTFFP